MATSVIRGVTVTGSDIEQAIKTFDRNVSIDG